MGSKPAVYYKDRFELDLMFVSLIIAFLSSFTLSSSSENLGVMSLPLTGAGIHAIKLFKVWSLSFSFATVRCVDILLCRGRYHVS